MLCYNTMEFQVDKSKYLKKKKLYYMSSIANRKKYIEIS